ncbi:unnamed protein product [Miscanthus lutarioriparius]|uniref:O-fucosyltransferase family protein n=1 Tax=Miscanthus lutarioriparius TaxID=422564 RepID=A0A811RUN1_9POAL|nr:unnamed protein product [Miscanthus lutarioriparius]
MQGHAYSRLGSFGSAASAPSPPLPPSPSSPVPAGAGAGGGSRTPAKAGSARGIPGAAASATAVARAGVAHRGGAARRLARAVLATLLRRQAVFLFAPLLYVAAMLLYMGSLPLDAVPRIIARQPPGSVYRSPQLYARLRADMDADNSTGALATVWRHTYKGGTWRPCIKNVTNGLPESNGYIYIEANGGLNQQRTSICNAVAIAGFLNATLIIPNFHFHSIWRDPSKFSDIYDKDHFVQRLQNDVRVVDKIPDFIMERFGHNLSNVFNFKIKAWARIQYYKDVVFPKLVEERFIRISPFANRLSFDAPSAVQRLRCLANFEALKFSKPIVSLSETLVSRMREKSVAVMENISQCIFVLRRLDLFHEIQCLYVWEPRIHHYDMIAFSCCVYDGGDEEKKEMDAAREIGWRGKFTKRGRVIRPGVIRMNGKCPLTPLEVGLMLRGMGFSNKTAIFLASGKIYRAEKNMASLLEMFPLLQTKETLASEEELAPFKNFSSRMAAVDYSVCAQSEVFVTTQGGNFPHFLMGHRRYLYGGHSKTIKPDKRRLALLFDNPRIGWKALKRHLLNMRAHSDAKGIEMKRPNESIYTFPFKKRDNIHGNLTLLQERVIAYTKYGINYETIQPPLMARWTKDNVGLRWHAFNQAGLYEGTLMTRTTGQTTLQQTTKPKNIKTETSMSEQAPTREEGLSNEQELTKIRKEKRLDNRLEARVSKIEDDTTQIKMDIKVQQQILQLLQSIVDPSTPTSTQVALSNVGFDILKFNKKYQLQESPQILVKKSEPGGPLHFSHALTRINAEAHTGTKVKMKKNTQQQNNPSTQHQDDASTHITPRKPIVDNDYKVSPIDTEVGCFVLMSYDHAKVVQIGDHVLTNNKQAYASNFTDGFIVDEIN